MTKKTKFEELMASPEFRRLYVIEGLVAEAGEFIARLMEERKVKKAELARRLGKSRAYVTQMLSGSANLTVRTLAEVAYALGVEVKLEAVPLEAARQEAESPRAVWRVIEFPGPPAGLPAAASAPGTAGETDISYSYVA